MAKKQTKKHFVFDLDDTLVDGRQFCGETIARAIKKYEPDIDFNAVVDYHEKVRGRTINDLYDLMIKEFKLKTDKNKLLEEDKKIQIAECERMLPFDGVEEILTFLKDKGKMLHVCTNRTLETLDPILESIGIKHYFDTITSCIEAGHKKPDPTTLNELIQKYGKQEEFIYFGDSTVDSDFAKNADIDFVIFDQYLNEKNLFKKLINMFLEDQINGN